MVMTICSILIILSVSIFVYSQIKLDKTVSFTERTTKSFDELNKESIEIDKKMKDLYFLNSSKSYKISILKLHIINERKKIALLKEVKSHKLFDVEFLDDKLIEKMEKDLNKMEAKITEVETIIENNKDLNKFREQSYNEYKSPDGKRSLFVIPGDKQ